MQDPKVDVFVHGSEESVASQLGEVKKFPGLNKIFVAKHDKLHNPYSKALALISQQLVQKQGYDNVIASSTGFGKDLMPRIGGLLDLQAITDVIEIKEGGAKFVRPIYAGNALCTVSTIDKIKLLTIRNTNFEKVAQGSTENDYAVEEPAEFPEIVDKTKGRFIENIVAKSEMADLTTAKYVVSGGRALKSNENFQMLYDIAETLGTSQCAIGASRAAVDAGMVPNELQVGQTGKVVAPDVYFAIGISGAIQHISGMKDSKVIVAINKDGDAPIFKIANYGLVGDLFKILPELNEKLKAATQ
uniref:Electron transfer flavoprotein subunit alpha n=1 Tax=Strombidium rassoulzadegani TaxID=1082188 RepID=A0A7S3CHY8_9SPIT|mmetsp:Transcript_11136/g.18688  ORF Transcript_11136/g.18688 Transcript_11136/m.18688 type:complete len:302 (+) Transcript_11136:199-1104(+)